MQTNTDEKVRMKIRQLDVQYEMAQKEGMD